MFTSLICTAFLSSLLVIDAIPIDNGVTGEPEIECAANGISVNFNTQNVFEGHVYVKNRFDEPGCRSDEGGRNVASIRLPFSACGTERTRSVNPRGIFVRQTIIVSFHPNFLTKIDRAYLVQCFYMEADKTVSTDIEVSMITTVLQTLNLAMPDCRYEILDGAGGNVVEFAIIGQAVLHKWTCESDHQDKFCMRVHSCFVDDGAGDRIDTIDVDGCSLDKYIIGNLEYPMDLMAQKEAHVFKYADRPALAFQCQIDITIKEPNGECPLPTCAEPIGFGSRSSVGAGSTAVVAPIATEEEAAEGRLRVRREVDELTVAVVDVRTVTIETLETLNQGSIGQLPNNIRQLTQHPLVVNQSASSDICLSTSGLSGALLVVLVMAIMSTALISVYLLRRSSSKLDQFA